MSGEDRLRYFLKQVTANLHETRQRLQKIEAAAEEPIAIVGMGCRFPGGARSPEDLWGLVAAGADTVAGLPTDRGWESMTDPDRAGEPGRVGVGSFVYEATEFDAGFFGISPREATAMDPQQRLLLETSWEALERAGIDPSALRGSKTGVFAGASFAGYGWFSDREGGLDGHLMTGNATSILSGRLSYTLGLEGPAVTVDTACSSALVALHLACRALRAGECSLALVGGAFVAALPVLFTDFGPHLGLTTDGRCKAFSAAADGMGVAEGAGVLVVERLSVARRNGHKVLAVVRGSAINQDGASNGLTAPNGPSQQRVIRAALEDARLSAADIDVVEAHGTGTPLGDPIEAQALIATYGQERPEGRPLWLGSVKANIGHAQQAAGVAGMMKMVLALQHGVLPRSPYSEDPSPHVDWSAGTVRLLTEAVPWPAGSRPRRGAVSGFGMSGTNVHVIVEEAPRFQDEADEPADEAGSPEAALDAAEAVGTSEADGTAETSTPAPALLADTGLTVWPVSGRSADGLAAQAGRLREFVVGRPELTPADVAWSLATTRSAFEHRGVLIGGANEAPAGGVGEVPVASAREALTAGLAALATGQSAPGLVTGVATSPGRTVFVFPGQGSQWTGMARELLEASPLFAARFAECAEALSQFVDWSLYEALDGPLDTADVVQPVLFAVMVSLAAVWQAAGIAPDAVVGHSQGEIAAACVAGILSLEDAARVVALRSRALSGLKAEGGLLSVVMPQDKVAELAEPFEGRLSIAAVNSPAATVVSGHPDALAELEAELSRRKVMRWRVPASDFVAHSAAVEAVEEVLLRDLAGIRPADAETGFFSTALNRWMRGSELDAAYWYANVRQTVRFQDAIVELASSGHRTFVEVSAQPVLTTAITESVEEAGLPAPLVTGTVQREDAGPGRLLKAFAHLHVHGASVDWSAVLGGGERVDLPTYAFQRRRYWMDAAAGSEAPALEPTAGSQAEADFWSAVEDGDVGRVAGTLAVDDARLAELLPALASWRRRERIGSVLADWRYLVTWAPVAEPAQAMLSGTWLVVAPAEQPAASAADAAAEGLFGPPSGADTAEACVRALTSRGAEVLRLDLDTDDLDRDVLTARLAEFADTGLAGVLSLLPLDETPLPDFASVPAGLAGTLLLFQALGDAGIPAPLWSMTQGSVSTGPSDTLTRPAQAQVWGLGRVAGLEQPERWGGLVDLPPVLDDRARARLVAVLAGLDAEDQVAVRATGIFGRRLVRAPRARKDAPWTPRGTVLITGGTGALGGHLGPWLAARGAERVVLTSRSGPAAAGVAELAAQLAAAGTRVDVVAGDSAARADVAGLLERIAADGPPLTSVIHAALVFDDAPVARLEVERLARALAAKSLGAQWLDELTQGLDLDAFVMFSSIAAIWGAGHEPGYGAGNAYLDALAENRLARGLTATSVAYGPWASGGPTEGDARVQLERRGLRLLDPPTAVEALAEILDGGEKLVTVADATWERFAPTFTLRRRSPLIEALPEVRRALAAADPAEGGAGAPAAAAVGELAGRLAGLSRAEQDRLLVDVVRAEAASVLGHASVAEVEPGRAFSDLGFDSLTSVELRNRLGETTGLRLPATLLFDYPNPAVLADFLRSGLVADADAAAADPETGAAARRVALADEPVAIVSMGCRFPGGVDSPERLWELLAGGGDAISGFPADRDWDPNLYHPDPDHPGTSYVREGGFIHAASEFDAAFFGISPREALAMDPQQRLLLEVTWEALERAGMDPASLHGSRTGVFVGGAGSGYDSLGMALALSGTEGIEGHLATGNAGSVISGRVSYVLGLEGPSLTIDTACSSALVALHLACQAVQAGECDLALAGGVTMLATPAVFIGFSRQRGLAVDGRCKAFSADADGMGMGEGAGMVLVERLSDARRNGHQVLAVIRGSAVNQDGASNGLTAPNGPSQQRVIRAALANAGIPASEVDAVEAHGTGTTLGDPIEAQALLATYGQERSGGRPLWLGSVKSNIGHSQSAAGIAGVMKMVLALRNGLLPRTLHADEASPHIDWSAGEVRLLTEAVPWEANGHPRRAGVSAFGMSGTNAHVIVEEAPAWALEPDGSGDEPGADQLDAAPIADGAAADSAGSSGHEAAETALLGGDAGARMPVLAGTDVTAWSVSGRSSDSLAGQAGRLREHVLSGKAEPGDVAWSLATTRSTFEHRAVVIGTEREALAARLASVATGQQAPGVVSGTASATTAGRVAFVFPGQGSQWTGMARELLAASPVFAAKFAECAEALAPYIDWSLDDALDGPLDRADVVQPVLFAVMVSLATVWQAAGVNPDAVVGHSQGEIAAACVAGILTLGDAARVVALRSRALSSLDAIGGLLSIVMPQAKVAELLEPFGGRLSIAAVNSPAATVVSGHPDALMELEAQLAKLKVMRWRVPASDFVAHSATVEAVEDVLLRDLAPIRPADADTAFYSTALSRWMRGSELDAAYWYANVRRTVQFQDAVTELAGSGYRTFIEVSAQPVLTIAITESVEEAGLPAPIVTGTVQREDAGPARLLTSLAQVHVHGVTVDWSSVLPQGARVGLPTYAFQRRRYWLKAAVTPETESSEAESRFWSAVEDGDLHELAGAMDLDVDRPLKDALPALASWRRREREGSVVAGWRYRVSWVPLPEPGSVVLAGRWVLAAPDGHPLAAEVAGALAQRGAEVVTVAPDLDRAVLAGRLAAADAVGVVSLLDLAHTLVLTQALGDAELAVPIWALTRGAVATGPGEAPDPEQAQVWGLGRVVALEHPERWGGLVDLPAVFDDAAAGRLCAVLAGGGEDQVAVRLAGVLARRLGRASQPHQIRTWTPRGTALVTGGTGALAGHVVRWLTERGAERVVLASRSGAAASRAVALAAELAVAGTRVDIVACDFASRDATAGLLDHIAADGPAVSSVFHTAGLGEATMLADTTVGQQRAILAAKADGARWLDELTREAADRAADGAGHAADHDAHTGGHAAVPAARPGLDAFITFSSISATWGGGSQADYAAANAHLDALAERRRAEGLAATSVAWGPWGGGGMTDQEGAEQMRRRGLLLMDPALAIQALAQAVDADETLLTVADMDWPRFAPTFVLRRPSPLIEALPEVSRALAEADAAANPASDGTRTALAEQLAGLSRLDQARTLTDLVRAEAAAVLAHASAQDVEPDRAFSDMGFDSLTSVELRNRLSAATGLRLPATLLFDYPNPTVLAEFLWDEEFRDAGPPSLLAELDRLDAALAAALSAPENPGGDEADGDLRELIAARLQDLASRWSAREETAGTKAVAQHIDSASDDEIFEFIHRELGRS